ncbi:MAG: hypothetical protein KZQ89_02890 [Candidatus Thiodiazotropha sp. (ex Lucinoma kastoroae)]|nr:hypothetical protein [Candidatus Thiodiazotropha sp. (ex Lucinoma kastoroae)]
MALKRMSRREKLELEISRKQAQLKDFDAREKVKERKRDTRRKIIAGALALEHGSKNDDFKTVMNRLINEHVNNNKDRELFDLPPLESFQLTNS